MAAETDGSLDLRALETVSEFSGHLMCAICHCPFIQPVRLQCDHIFCQTCLNGCIRTPAALGTFTQPPDDFLCPSCRTPTNASFQTVPRLILAMCDEILVKCPYSKEGCEETVQRGHVKAHVGKYCDCRLVRCPEPLCDRKTRKKDLDPDGKCRHVLRECEECGDILMDLDYKTHAEELCPKLETTCPDCEVSLLRVELADHRETCSKATRACSGQPYGCQVKCGISEIEAHEKTCSLVTLGPYLEAQSSRLASMDSTIRQLQQRNETLEEGIASLRSTLVSQTVRPLSRSSVAPSSSTLNNSGQILPTELAGSESNSEPDPQPPTPSTATTYLLSLHESLREEVTRLASALNTVDARANMSIINENLRLREDMAHINAGLNTVRMQVHMLMNLRSHQGQRTDPSRPTPPGGDTLGSAGSSRVNAITPEALRNRRLSDTGREVTKL